MLHTNDMSQFNPCAIKTTCRNLSFNDLESTFYALILRKLNKQNFSVLY